MLELTLKIKEIFEDLVPSFGLNHAKIYSALISREVKNATQLMQETSVSGTKTYKALNDLIKYELVYSTRDRPTAYYTKNPTKDLNNLVNKKISLLEKKPETLKEILNNWQENDQKSYLIQISGTQTKITDSYNKIIVKNETEIKTIRKQLDTMLEEMEKKKVSQYAIYK